MNESAIGYFLLGVIISLVLYIVAVRGAKFLRLLHRRRNHARTMNIRPAHVPPPIPSAVQRAVSRATPDRGGHRAGGNSSGPPLPAKSSTTRNIENFPKCPQCGSRNRKGYRQLVFEDAGRNRWRCYNGHKYSS